MHDFEKLGAFYLGKRYDNKTRAVTDELFLYDSKDLTTHGLVVGMTGSGKTGLSVSLLEDAAIDGIPAIAIDPKGDLGNLFLTFPDLAAADFAPWIDPDEATRKGMDVKSYAQKVASSWQKGLADWGQDGARIQKFKDSCELALYTPGSVAGRPLKLLKSFVAPTKETIDDGDAMRERVLGVTAGLLSLLKIEADPVRSREYILISNLLDRAWRAGEDYELTTLINQIQNPPFERLGIMDLETFFPAKERGKLTMLINSLLASPGFGAWLEGEALDINRLLYNDDGKPKLSIISIAHLSDQERMFFVSILLNEMVSWVRAQPGTSSLRALLYMDEIAGFFPPTANPPSKPPMLTLLKQARAHGLGVLLATQNPVDLDYKGLSNIGTWFLGRLQTEQDKARIIDGLEGATNGGLERKQIDNLLSGLGKRVFLINNVHENGPELFHTRWALSYLRGPLTRAQIKQLASVNKAAAPTINTSKAKHKPTIISRPLLPVGLTEKFAPISHNPPSGEKIIYRPNLQAKIQLHFVLARAGIDYWQPGFIRAPIHDETIDNIWHEAPLLSTSMDFTDEPADGINFASLPVAAMRKQSYTSWQKKLKSHLYAQHNITIYHCPTLKAYSAAGQNRADFIGELGHKLREHRDLKLEKLRNRYAPKIERIQDKIQTQEARIEKEQEEHSGQKLNAAISIGASILGALFGRKLTSSRNVGRTTAAIKKSVGISRSGGDVKRAEERLESLQEDLQKLDDEFQDENAKLADELTIEQLKFKEINIRPRKTDIETASVSLLWLPWLIDADGIAQPLD